jgi:cytoskeletal protein CcmA (bactofilin family)
MSRVLTTVALIVMALAIPAAAHAQAPPPWPEVGGARVTTLQETGPATERLNLIVMCDGYTLDEMAKCREDVDRNHAIQWGVEPFRSYRNYINVYLLEIVSGESGVRCDPDEEGGPKPQKLTPLRLIYDDGCVDPLARGTIYNDNQDAANGGPGGPGTLLPPGVPTGSQQRNMYLNEVVAPAIGLTAPIQSLNNVQTLAIFNTFTYGGIGGTHATTSGGSPQGPLISLHELGHSLGNMQDEYPYSSRTMPGGAHPNTEPSSFHHTRMSSPQMTAAQAKWWRWLGERSDSGGLIRAADPDGYESGVYMGSNVWRPSSHSIMRWIGFYWDQIGRERMTGRISGRRNAAAMALGHRPAGTVGRDEVLWVDPQQPRNHELKITWKVDGQALSTNGSPTLDLEPLDLDPGAVVEVEVRDPVGPDGIDWVRDASTDGHGFNSPRYVQTRQWTVGSDGVTPSDPADELITGGTPTERPVGGSEWVYVETAHPADRVLDVEWAIDGQQVSNAGNPRNLDIGALDLRSGTYRLTATVKDGGASDTREWTVDNVLPTAPRRLSGALTSLSDDHPVYFDGWDMFLDPQDNQTDRYIVGELRLNRDGWYNYFGFPEGPMPETPFQFRHSGTDIKALTYGNLGTGGLSKAAFEQDYGPDDPNGPFVPGFGTHTVEHRAVDPAGNIGKAGEYEATVLPGASPECTTTITGQRNGNLTVTSGVTCLDDARVNGNVTVSAGATLVASDGSINGNLTSTGAREVQLFGTRINGNVRITNTTNGVTTAGTTFNGNVILSGNRTVPDDEGAERFSQYGYAYGPILAGNRINGNLACSGNSAPARDFEAPNRINGNRSGDCSEL